jgi:hypothetical protein
MVTCFSRKFENSGVESHGRRAKLGEGISCNAHAAPVLMLAWRPVRSRVEFPLGGFPRRSHWGRKVFCCRRVVEFFGMRPILSHLFSILGLSIA